MNTYILLLLTRQESITPDQLHEFVSQRDTKLPREASRRALERWREIGHLKKVGDQEYSASLPLRILVSHFLNYPIDLKNILDFLRDKQDSHVFPIGNIVEFKKVSVFSDGVIRNG